MKKLINPIQIFITLVLCSALSSIYLSIVFNFDSNLIFGWKMFSLAFMIVCLITLIALFVFHYRNKKLVQDEFTTKIILKAGFYSYISMSMLITLAFITLAIFTLSNKNYSLNDLLDFRVTLSAIAIIQILGSLLFMILYSRFYKKGDI
ncbi:MAG TPA: hypothetical protein GX692_05110 [Acholeplasmataceae bacterium]|nr:hypothetical protein [Acholeplasmataceae bacterium]